MVGASILHRAGRAERCRRAPLQARWARYSVTGSYASALMCGAFALRPLFVPGGGLGFMWPVVTFLLIIPGARAMWLLRVGQAGQKLVDSMEAGALTAPGDGTADTHWVAGIFYCNPDDPAVLVEKRLGFGWTLNFGNRVSWLLAAALAGGLLAAVLLTRWIT